jgi:hypothetical protein
MLDDDLGPPFGKGGLSEGLRSPRRHLLRIPWDGDDRAAPKDLPHRKSGVINVSAVSRSLFKARSISSMRADERRASVSNEAERLGKSGVHRRAFMWSRRGALFGMPWSKAISAPLSP